MIYELGHSQLELWTTIIWTTLFILLAHTLSLFELLCNHSLFTVKIWIWLETSLPRQAHGCVTTSKTFMNCICDYYPIYYNKLILTPGRRQSWTHFLNKTKKKDISNCKNEFWQQIMLYFHSSIFFRPSKTFFFCNQKSSFDTNQCVFDNHLPGVIVSMHRTFSVLLPIIFVPTLLSAFYICCVYSNVLQTSCIMKPNIMNPNQTAPKSDLGS